LVVVAEWPPEVATGLAAAAAGIWAQGLVTAVEEPWAAALVAEPLASETLSLSWTQMFTAAVAVVEALCLAGELHTAVEEAAVLDLRLAASVRLLGVAAQGLWELVLQEPLLPEVAVVAAQLVELVREAKFAFGQSGDQHEKS
jgi:hypothetical protein